MKKVLLALLLIIIVLPLAYSKTQYETTEDEINIRVDSTVFSDSLGYISKGQILEIIEEKFDWYKIVLPKEFNCYISKKYVKKINDDTVRTIASTVNLRSSPSLESQIIGQAPLNAEFHLIREGNDWFEIRGCNYAHGWVNKKFVHKVEKNTGLSTFVDEAIPKLSDPNINNNEKEKIYQELTEKGKVIIPLLESYILTADENTAATIESILTNLAHDDSDLALVFLEKINPAAIKISGVYLDVLRNLTDPESANLSYSQLALEGQLSVESISEAKQIFEQKIKIER